MQDTEYEVQEKTVDTMLVAGVRMKGHYSDCGKGFSRIGRSLGRFICGKPLLLHYDREYREGDADFEACMPVKKLVEKKGISTRELPGGRCVSLLHKGPWDELGRSYEKITAYVKQHGYDVELPTREIYLKGPGIIFRGNPQNYLTEIQMMVSKPEA
jgi:effector-binding domain-containing protein